MISPDNTPAILATELGELSSLWEETRSGWNDRMAEEFEVVVILPLQSAVLDLRATLVENSAISP